MVVQILLDSFSRCFGAPGSDSTGRKESGRNKMASSDGKNVNRRLTGLDVVDNNYSDIRRRRSNALGVELQHQEWDVLFSADEKKKSSSPSRCRSNSMPIDNTCSTANTTAVSSITHNTSGKSTTLNLSSKSSTRTRRKKRDKSAIFRKKKSESDLSLASRLIGKDGIKALCFATPLNDGSPSEIDNMSSLCHTLDTADDTTVSNYFTDTQYSSVTGNHAPMPLFSHFKVDCNDSADNTLMSIIVSGSHHSSNVNHLFVRDASPNNKTTIIAKSGPPNTLYVNKSRKSIKNTSKSKSPLPRSPRKKPFDKDSIPPPVQRISGSNSTFSIGKVS